MPKNKKPNKGEEFFYKLSLNAEFQDELVQTRNAVGISENGFTNESEYQQWIEKCKGLGNSISRIFKEIKPIQKKFGIPGHYASGLYDYICWGRPNGHFWHTFDVAAILSPLDDEARESLDLDIESFYKENEEPYVKLLIFGHGTKSDVLEYIKNNWNEVEEILKQQGWKPQGRTRETVFKERNLRIKELWRKPKEELQIIIESIISTNIPIGRDKELLIRRILKHEGYGEVDDGYIRKMGANTTKRSPSKS